MNDPFETMGVDADAAWAWWLSSTAKITVWFAIILAAEYGLRRRSPALRHLTAVAGTLAVPLVLVLNLSPIPEADGWRPGEWWTRTTATLAPMTRQAMAVPAPSLAGVESADGTDGHRHTPWPQWVLLIWALGTACSWATLALRWWRANFLRRRCAAFPRKLLPPEFHSLRVLRGPVMPMTVGLVHPAILLPMEAPAWPRAHLTTILRHEATHVRRRDTFWEGLALVALAPMWWHPLARRLRTAMTRSREEASDDAVLRAGVSAHDYAEVLLHWLRTGRRASTALAAGIGPRVGWRRRLSRLFDASADRRPLARWQVAAVPLSFMLLAASGTLMVGCAGHSPRSRVPIAFPEKLPEPAPELPRGTKEFEVKLVFFELTLSEDDTSKLPDFAAAVAGQKTKLSPEEGWQLFHIRRSGADLLTAPRFTSKPGQRVKVEVIREFRHPATYTRDAKGNYVPATHETRDTGMACDVIMRRRVSANEISLRLEPSLVEFAGFRPHPTVPGVEVPLFSTRKAVFDDTLENGGYVIVGAKRDVRETTDEVPGLAALPVVGRLFRVERKEKVIRLAGVRVIVRPAP